jgi:hypothetical protein
VGPGETETFLLWRQFDPQPGRIDGMAAGRIPVQGHLPEAGGAGDQAAIMMDAFAVMSAAWSRIQRRRGGGA